jgi:uncharacterized peroxidase-related enzyme
MNNTRLTERDFPIHSIHTAPTASKEALQWYHDNFGMVPNLAGVMAESPALLLSYWQTQNNLLQRGALTPREVNIVETVVAHHNRCQYCVAGHTAFGTTPVFGNTDAELQAIRHDADLGDAKLNALRDFTVRVLEKQGRMATSQLEAFLQHGYTRAQAMDVVACIAVKVMSNFTNQLALTPIDAAFAPLAEGLPYREVRMEKAATTVAA